MRNTLLWAGFKRGKSDGCNLLWSRHQSEREIQSQHNQYRKLNHWPGSWSIGRKDRLARNVARFKRTHGDMMGICPPTFLLPAERKKLKQALSDSPKDMWIVKPVNASCGRGIRLVSGATVGDAAEQSMATSLPSGSKRFVAQRYVQQPYLINGTKFDLRVYCCVTSFDPLRVYVYEEGLVRFATQPYSVSANQQGNRFAHLTNYSVNKKADGFGKNTSAAQDATGSKWSLSALFRHLGEAGVDAAAVRASIHDLCVKTILCCEPEVTALANSAFKGGNALEGTGTPCFEVYGVDVILDEALRPWLLEVNVSPSLSSSSPMDKRIKTMLMTDVFHMVGFVPFDAAKAAKAQEAQRKERLLGQAVPRAGRPALPTRTQAADLAHMQLRDLSAHDIAVICETEDEFARRGHFTRVFPTQRTAKQYGQLFETVRYNNLLLDMWLTQWKPQMDPATVPVQLRPAVHSAASTPASTPRSADQASPSTSTSHSPSSTKANRQLPATVAAVVKARESRRAASGSGKRPSSSRPPSAQSSSSGSGTPKSRSSSGRPRSALSTAAAQRAADAARARKASTASRIEQRFAMYRQPPTAGLAGGGSPKLHNRPGTAMPTLRLREGIPSHARTAASAPTSARDPPGGSRLSVGGRKSAAGGAAAAIHSRRALHGQLFKQQQQQRKAASHQAPPLYRYNSKPKSPSQALRSPAAVPVTAAMLAGRAPGRVSIGTTSATQPTVHRHGASVSVSTSLPTPAAVSAAAADARLGSARPSQRQRRERRPMLPGNGRFKVPPASPIAADWASDDEAAPPGRRDPPAAWYRGRLVRAQSGGVAFR